MLNFKPKPEEELVDLLESGDGAFQVIEAAEKMSKSQNQMIELKLKVMDAKGNEGTIFDYLMLNGTNYSLRRIRHFCYSCGLGASYERGSLGAKECIGKQGKLKIDFKKGDNGYQDKNVVKDYVVDESPDKSLKMDPRYSSAQTETFDDELPDF